MNKNGNFASVIASLASAAFATLMISIASAVPASAQAFLNPVPSPSSPSATFLEQSAVSSGGATGAQNNSSNLLTGAGAIATSMQRQFSLNQSGNGLLAPNSVNMAPFPSGTYSYGFAKPNYGPGLPNHYGMYNGAPLPPTATSSVDINIVDCGNLSTNYAPGQYNPWANNYSLSVQNPNGTTTTLNLMETATEAQTFLQNSLSDATSSFE
jgi:hypothetical protein